jgi:hypothetical protein
VEVTAMADPSARGQHDALWAAADVRVFISYDMTRDAEVARRLANDFELLGCGVWYAGRDLGPGQGWAGNIDPAIERSTHAAILLNGAQMSDWMDHETRVIFDRRMNRKMELVPVIVEPGAVLPALLSGLQAVDLTSGYAQGLASLALEWGVADDTLDAREEELIARWKGGLTALREQRTILRRQEENLKQHLAAERQTSDRLRQKVDDVEAEAKAAQKEADRLSQKATHAGVHARELADAARSTAMKADQASGVTATLAGRLEEMQAAHKPTFDLVERAERLVATASQTSPFDVPRDSDVVELLERPQAISSLVSPSAATTARGFAHRHRLGGALLAAIEQAGLPEERRHVALTWGVQGLDAEFPPGVDLGDTWDDEHVQELERNLARAFSLPEDEPDGRPEDEAALAFMHYASHACRQRPKRPGAAPDETSAPPPTDTAYDVVLVGADVDGAGDERDGLIQAIRSACDRVPERAELQGFFEARAVVRRASYPLRILRGVDFEQAHAAERSLVSAGGIVKLEPADTSG